MWKFRNPDDTAWNVLANKPLNPDELATAIEVPDDDPDVLALTLPPTGNAAIVAQIDVIESAHPFTHRYFREQLLAAVQAGIIPANHPVAQVAAQEDAVVQSLRKQLK